MEFTGRDRGQDALDVSIPPIRRGVGHIGWKVRQYEYQYCYHDHTATQVPNMLFEFICDSVSSSCSPPAVYFAGNLIRTPDGRLAILDFGLMVRALATEREGI